MAEDNRLDQKLQEAKNAMEGEERKKMRQAKNAELEKLRLLARQSMEGAEQRKRREAREKLARERVAQVEAEKAATAAALFNKAQSEKAEAERKAKAEAEAKSAKEQNIAEISESENLIEKLKVKELNLSPLRTYKSDMAKAVKEGGISISKIALTEQARNRLGKVDETGPSTGRRPTTLIVLAILVLAAMGGGGYWWLYLRPDTTPIKPVTNQPKSLIFSENAIEVTLATDPVENLKKLNTEIDKLPLAPAGQKTITNVYFTRGSTEQNWATVGQAFKITPPDTLTRTLNQQFMLGVYHSDVSSYRFLLLKNRDANQALAGLLTWEHDLAYQLLPLLRGQSASSTERQAVFTDKLYRNKNVRLIRNSENQVILLYAFFDPQTILITQNEEAFSEIFDRYLNGGNILVN